MLQLNLLIQAYDYVIANYSDALESYGAAVGSGLSASGLAEAKAIRDRVVEEFGCVSAVSIFIFYHSIGTITPKYKAVSSFLDNLFKAS